MSSVLSGIAGQISIWWDFLCDTTVPLTNFSFASLFLFLMLFNGAMILLRIILFNSAGGHDTQKAMDLLKGRGK